MGAKMIQRVWLASLFAVFLTKTVPLLAKREFSWLAYGDLRGSFEPCGCDPKTDLGGVARIAAILTRERLLDRNVMVFDLGNNVTPPVGVKKAGSVTVKDRFIWRAMAKIQPTAALPGKFEILRSNEFLSLDDLTGMSKKMNFTLVNYRSSKGPRWLSASVSEAIRTPEAFITGILWDDSLSSMLDDPLSVQVLRRMRNISKSAKDRDAQRVLLYSGPTSKLIALRETGLFDVIVTNSELADDILPSESPVSRSIAALVRLAATEHQPAVMQTAPGCPGILRGGIALTRTAPSLKDIFKTPMSRDSTPSTLVPTKVIMGEGNALSESVQVTWLDPDLENPDVWSDFFKQYELAVKSNFNSNVRTRKKLLASSSYAGSDVCASCHAEAFSVWSKSSHAKAFSTLVDKNKSEDAECVGCHVLAFYRAGGFVSFQDSPQFANVHCENCHGPRKNHVTDPLVKPDWKPQGGDYSLICKSCHQGSHSPDFQYPGYWKKIEHGSK